MQFKRIKLLMLILFLLLDIFLFNWWRAGRVVNDQVTDANVNIIDEMKNQKIRLPQFSTKVRYSSYVAAQRGDKQILDKVSLGKNATISEPKDKNGVIVKFKTAKSLEKNETSRENEFDSQSIAAPAGYRYNNILTLDKNNTDRVYSQHVFGLPVISDYGIMTFQYNNVDKVTGFTQRKLINIEKLRDDRATITEEEAIIALYRYNEIGSGDRLSDGQLSYDTTIHVNGFDIYLPVWAFEAYSGHEKYILKINAFTGENMSE
ncbi:hypothetical protein FE410_07470 [Leuconostoc carnosum]|uniref:two-component system regulatory protein YycI n=1 Tax=Leuconostoc carnosum TaxID=1252 RepID=UPI00123A1282|nr:two-component system regulatory protein YycI [Leuconostoc carnosum]KAA8369375.1 hypothetical protein FE414_07710 [Leuconostoc carnosum]KAA8380393.1 hypothetical protein FE410_07470 [Leuconostoc carnosum]